MSSDSGMFENPFREGGKLSRDAEVIIDALKTGKLSVISNQVMMIMIMMKMMMMLMIIIIFIINALNTGKLSVISNQVREEAKTSREIHVALQFCMATAYGSVLLYLLSRDQKRWTEARRTQRISWRPTVTSMGGPSCLLNREKGKKER